jgi:hypothetical protein
MPSRIIVLGMVRSGTSITTRLVQRWGAYTGPESDLFGDRYGYLEHLGLQKLNDNLMDHNDRIPPDSELLIQRSQDPIYRERALQLLISMDAQTRDHGVDAWVWKDPRLPMLLPFWTKIWDDVIYVIPIRHPLEIIFSAASMEGVAADDLPVSAGLTYWQYNLLNLISFTQGSKRKLFLSFDQLTQNPLAECVRLCHFLDEQCGKPAADAQQLTQTLASEVLSQERHFHEQRSLSEIGQATREQRALYDFLRVKITHSDEAFDQNDFSLYPGWREYLQAMDALLALSQARES